MWYRNAVVYDDRRDTASCEMMDRAKETDINSELRRWFLARLRRQALEDANAVKFTPATLIKADHELLEQAVRGTSSTVAPIDPNQAGFDQNQIISPASFLLAMVAITISQIIICIMGGLYWPVATVIVGATLICQVYLTVNYRKAHDRMEKAVTTMRERAPEIVEPASSHSKPLEEWLAAVLLQLERARERERLIADFPSAVVCAFNDQLQLVSVSPSSNKIWGIHPMALVGRFMHEITGQTQDLASLQAQFKQAQITAQEQQIETRFERSDAQILDVRWTASWSESRSLYFAICEDISQEVRLRKLRQDFFALMSHDLQAPMTGVYCVLAGLERREDISQDGKQRVKMAMATLDYLSALVENVLEWHKIEHNHSDMMRSELDCHSLIAEVAAHGQPLAEEKQIDFRWSAAHARISGDRIKLKRALINLLSNSFKFSKKKGVVELEATAIDDNIEIKIQDFGIGISEADLPHVFDHLYQTPDSRSKGGSGLGLSICRSIIQAHGGTIEVESELNVGTKFVITLPLIVPVRDENRTLSQLAE